MDMFNNNEGFYFYLGRPTCEYCRAFSPVLKSFSERISLPIYYYDMDQGDWGKEIGQFLMDRMGLEGIPTLIYIKNGKPLAKQIGDGPNVNELLGIFSSCPQ